MIRLVTGPLGTGKSYYMVKKGVEGLEEGRMLVTNFSLVPDWAERVARRRRVFPNGRRAKAYVESLERRYFRVETLGELMQLRVRKERPWVRERRGQVVLNPDGEPVLKEGVCRVLLDEAHRWMNARSWSQGGREEVLEFFALARKMGFEVYLGSQRAQNLDVQVRELYEDHIQLENLKHSGRLLGVRVIPFNFFLAAWTNHGWPGRFVKEERYRLRWYRHLYDTMDVGSFTEAELKGGARLWLPGGGVDRHLDGDRRDRDGGTEGASAVAAAPAAPAPPVQDPSIG